jgi:hypothetical protein
MRPLDSVVSSISSGWPFLFLPFFTEVPRREILQGVYKITSEGVAWIEE